MPNCKTELDHPRKDLVNNQNIYYNEYFKWCLVRYSLPANHHPARITKADKDLARKRDFKDIKFLVKKSSIAIIVFGYGNMKKYPIN